MATNIRRPNGTKDVVPEQMYKWETVEEKMKAAAKRFGFKEIRVPTFEDTGLFVRSVGDTTDVVQKEMYSVTASSNDNYTLRPEGTAGVVRAILENGLLNGAMPLKLFYILSCFRHEKPQAGRLREFHQFGCEMAGSPAPEADAEIISLAKYVLDSLGLKNISLHINSIGCKTCRAKYHGKLKEYFEQYRPDLCSTCQERLDKNPMRILDCKSLEDQAIAANAPLITDFLCDDCKTHFEQLQQLLKIIGIDFVVDPKIVRGLDYYTRTVFEFISEDIGSQGTVCGGGRYDGLIQSLGGQPTPALGFGMGLERLILTMENQGCGFMTPETCDVYIAPLGENAVKKAAELAGFLRNGQYSAEYDLMHRSLKSQMKYADKIGASLVMIIGDNELEKGKAELRNMKTGEQTEVSLDESCLSTVDTVLTGEWLSQAMARGGDIL